MTTYAYDNWVLLPTRDLYDTQVMAMAINAAKDMYEKGELRIKDFNTAYGDFVTPIQADQDWYNLNVTGKVRDTINNLYAKGIDPLRSAEGRAIVALLVNNIPVGQVAKLRSSAKAAEEYIKNRGLLEAAGKYNSDLEERFLGYNLANWDTLGSGLVWNRTSPTEMKTLKELTESWYNNRTARDLTEADLKAAGIPYDKRYQYSGYLDSDILNVARGNTPGWNDSVYSRYYRDLAERQVAANGRPYTQQDVEARLLRNIADALQEWLINPTKKVDEYYKMAQQAAYARLLEGIRAANDRQIAQIKANGNSNVPDGGYSATTNMAADAEGTLQGQLVNYSNPKKMGAPNREFGQIGNLFMDTILNPNRYSDSQKKYIAKRAKDLGIDQLILNGDPRKAKSVEMNRKISIGLEGVADEISKISNGSSWYNKAESVNKMNNILHDVSSNAAMSTVNDILKEFGTVSEDGGVTLSTNYNRLCGVGSVMTDLLSRANADGRKHSKVDAALKHFQKSGNLKYSVNSWTAGAFDSRNNTDDWFPDNKVYATGNVVAGDKYYYIEVSNDPSDNSECCWFKVERNSERNGGINQVLSSITQKVDDKFLHEYSHTNVLGNPQSVVQKHNK